MSSAAETTQDPHPPRGQGPAPAVSVHGLVKSYDQVEARGVMRRRVSARLALSRAG